MGDVRSIAAKTATAEHHLAIPMVEPAANFVLVPRSVKLAVTGHQNQEAYVRLIATFLAGVMQARVMPVFSQPTAHLVHHIRTPLLMGKSKELHNPWI